MSLIAACSDFPQMAILRFDDFISRITMDSKVTWSAELLAGHDLHPRSCPLVVLRRACTEPGKIPESGVFVTPRAS